MKILTAQQMKTVEMKAVSNGMTFLRLMENAGSACARIIRESCLSNESAPHSITIISGNGKNGGDGFVIARKLVEAGYTANIILAKGSPKDADSAEMMKMVKCLPVNIIDYNINSHTVNNLIQNADILIDAIFGTGFYGIADDAISSLFEIINQSKAMKISIDIPSGLNSDSGKIFSECVKADLTIAVSDLKPVHILVPACKYCGKTVVADIGIPKLAYSDLDNNCMYSLNDNDVKNTFIPIELTAHKGNFGHLLSVCGSMKMPGAAVIAAKGAVLSGAGLVTAAFPKSAYSAISAHLTEPILLPLETKHDGTLSTLAIDSLIKASKKSTTLLIGCGLGLNRDTREIVKTIITNVECPIVLDADGINAICDDVNIIKNKNIILTPHPGEMAKLTGLTVESIQENRVKIALDFAREYGIVLILKGANTVVAEGYKNDIYVNTTGNPGMATGGSGDLLAGITASFSAQGMSPGDAARAGVYIHGLSADTALEKMSVRGLTPTACLRELPHILSLFESFSV